MDDRLGGPVHADSGDGPDPRGWPASRPWRALACLAGLLAGCTAEPVPDGAVRVWHSYRGAEREAFEAVLADLDASRDDLTIEVLAVPSQAYKSRLQNAIPRGNGPDLFVEAHELTGEWSQRRLIVPMAAGPGDFVPAAVDALRFGDALWGAPLAVKTVAMFHAGEPAPQTLESLLGRGRVIAWEVGEAYFQAPIAHALGARFLGPDGRPALDSEAMAASLAVAGELVSTGAVPAEADGAMVSTLFRQGEVPFVISGPWFVGELADKPFAVAPLPTVRGQAMRPFLTVDALFRAAQGQAADAAVAAVVAALTTGAGAVRRAVQGRQVPAERGALADPAVAGDAVLSAFARQAEVAVAMPNRPEMSVVWEPYNRALRAAIRGADPKDVLRRAQAEAESFLQPPPTPASPVPWLALLGALTLAAAGSLVQQVRRPAVRAALARGAFAYAWIGPALAGMAAVVFLPFVVGAGVSLFAHHGGDFTFVGLRNYWRILTSDGYALTDPMSFWYTLAVTLLWTAANVALHVGLGLSLALLLRDPWMKLKGVYRVLLIVPWAVPIYITALIWRGMFNEQFGAINAVLGWFGVEPVAWFGRFATSFAANLATNTWLGFPFMMVVSLGALQSIPRDLEEAAEVDGAGAWLRFRHVTLPLLRPALMPAVILGSVWTFNMFNVIYLVSAGEPDGSTEILISEAYRWAFTRQAQYGYASAYAVLVFGILWLYTRFTRRLAGEAA